MKTNLAVCSIFSVCLGWMLAGPISGAESKEKAKKPASRTVTLLDGKLKLEVPAPFVEEKGGRQKKELIKFEWEGGDAWGSVLRGTLGMKPDALKGYLDKRVAEYSKGLPAEFHVK